MAKQEFDKLPMKMNEYFNAKTGAAAAVETFPALHPVHGPGPGRAGQLSRNSLLLDDMMTPLLPSSPSSGASADK